MTKKYDNKKNISVGIDRRYKFGKRNIYNGYCDYFTLYTGDEYIC